MRTEKDLKELVDQINMASGSPAKPWNETGANIGNYHLSAAYGGWQLQRMTNIHGGIHAITSGYVSKREMYIHLKSFLNGIESV